MTQTEKIFIDRTPQGEFLMRMPQEAVSDLYEMILSAGLAQRRQFYGVKQQIEENYSDIVPSLVEKRRKAEKKERKAE